ncbi:MAG: hypothetical protein FJZ92_11995 [Chloroflexi bacterium]|nr:hypothetical protein [Chloroflexota bacterium]
MLIERVAQLAIALLVFVIGASVLSGSAASTAVPKSSTVEHSRAQGANDFKPAICAALTLTALVAGSGSFSGTADSELILGSAGADTITGNGGDDCILAGDGNDNIRAGLGTNAGGGNGVLHGGGGTDQCAAEGGTPTYINCEQRRVALLGAWVTGLTHAAVAGRARALIFVAMNLTNSVRSLTGVTYGGQVLSPVVARSSGGTTAVRTEIWILDGAGIAAATSSTFGPTWSAAPTTVSYASAFASDVNQASLTGATSNNAGTAPRPSPPATWPPPGETSPCGRSPRATRSRSPRTTASPREWTS